MARKKNIANKPTEQEQLKNLLRAWRGDFCMFMEGALNLKLSNQQRDLIILTQKMMEAKIRQAKGKKLTAEQKRLAHKIGISVHSGKGLGKDHTCAALIICVIFLYRPFKGICTANSSKQLEDVLSTEIKKLLKHSHPLVRDSFIVDKGGIYTVDGKGKKANDFMSKRTANVKASAEDNADTMQGYHEDYMMMVVDEASGVPDAVFKPMETTLTGLCNFAILIGNVMRANGYFYQTHYGKNDRKLWEPVRWDAEESDLEFIKPGLKAQIARILEKYGRDSNAFRMNISGLPPAEEEDALIPWINILAAQDRHSEMEVDVETDPTYLGVDVGGGVDDSSICRKVGGKVMSTKAKSTRDTTVLADWLNDEIEIYEPDLTVIDSNGLGHSFCDFFRKHYYNDITELNVGTGASNKSEYFRLRDELWFKVRNEFEMGTIAIPPDDEELALELSSLKVKDWSNPKKVMSKKEMKAKGLRSPNRADALMHCYIWSGTSAVDRKKEQRDKYQRQHVEVADNLSWMGI